MVGDPSSADDVLQETLVRIYRKLRWLKTLPCFGPGPTGSRRAPGLPLHGTQAQGADPRTDDSVLDELPADVQVRPDPGELELLVQRASPRPAAPSCSCTTRTISRSRKSRPCWASRWDGEIAPCLRTAHVARGQPEAVAMTFRTAIIVFAVLEGIALAALVPLCVALQMKGTSHDQHARPPAAAALDRIDRAERQYKQAFLRASPWKPWHCPPSWFSLTSPTAPIAAAAARRGDLHHHRDRSRAARTSPGTRCGCYALSNFAAEGGRGGGLDGLRS